MRWISFALTTQQVRDRTKTVTRRLGWRSLKVGDLLQGAVKCQGLKKGEHPEKICVVRVTKVNRETLDFLTKDDVVLEGFPEMEPHEFVTMFCEHNKCQPNARVTRIEFEYVEEA